MKVTIYRPTRSDEQTIKLLVGDRYEKDYDKNIIAFEVPDKEGFDQFDPFLNKYFYTTQEDNFKTWVNDETGETVQQKATSVRLTKHFDDGTVTPLEWKPIG